VLDESMAANHVALSALTGRPVMGVFQTLLAGNAGQLVPGIVVPTRLAADANTGLTSNEVTANAAATPQNLTRSGLAVGDAIRHVRGHHALTGGAYHRVFGSDVAGTHHNGEMTKRLTREFFAQDPVVVARALIGTVMVVAHRDQPLRAHITETEAYAGARDPASHAHRGPTPRTQIMFGPAGYVYVYKSYGIHWCINIVTGAPGVASAVLLRGALTLEGDSTLANMNGPGLLTRSLEITGADNGLDVCQEPAGRIYFLSRARGERWRVGQSTRIGISKGTDLPWRFFAETVPTPRRAT
jgi:DNA-3-methyladenine glycosylase